MAIDWTIPLIILQLIFLEGILSIDNAAVIGALVTPLPNDKEIPWPRPLAKIGHALRPMLGYQRMAALRVGLLGAYLGRGLMLLLASVVISNPWIKLVGAAYLIRLAFENLGGGHGGAEDEEGSRPIKVHSFWGTVLTVEMMDLVFSIDNVVTAVSLSDKLWVVLLGVAIGILAMRYAAGLFSYAVEREPVLKTAAYILVLNIGIELILEETGIYEVSDLARFAISIGTIVLSIAYARLRFLHFLQPVLVWISQGFGILDDLVNWLLVPPLSLIRFFWSVGKRTFAPQRA
jgi:tellurite resistance protein TerC